jgi:hypothetical protein
MQLGRSRACIIASDVVDISAKKAPTLDPKPWKASHCSSVYLPWPVVDTLLSLSYLSTKYSRIARVSLYPSQLSEGRDGYQEGVPNNEVVVVVVDNGGDAAIGVEFHEIRTLLLALFEVEIDGFIRQPKFFENDGDFPEKRIGCQTMLMFGEEGNKRTSHWDRSGGCTR